MKADFDSEANAVSIDLVDVDRWDYGKEIDPWYCTVAFTAGRPVNVSLLYPEENLQLLDRAAEKFGLDAGALRKAAKAALAVPDQVVSLDDNGRLAA
jgi:hypothetical protein